MSYSLTDWLKLEGGLGVYYTWYSEHDDVGEFRLWQGAAIRRPDFSIANRRFALNLRLRLEGRFRGISDWDMTLRARYKLSSTWPINNDTIQPGAYYVTASAEFFADIDSPGEVFADNRDLTIGLGYAYSKTWSFEVRYTWEEDRSTVGDEFSSDNHLVEFRVKSSLSLKNILKTR